MQVKPVPEGYHTLTPYLTVPRVSQLIEFLKQAFDAKERHRMMRPDGGVMHAEMQIGDSRVMMGEPMTGQPVMTASIYTYVPDVDSVYKKALAAGATSVREPSNEFYGDRSGGFRDPSGNIWWIATHIEDVAPEEMERRGRQAMQKAQGG